MKGRFSEELAPVRFRKNGKKGFIDNKGKIVIEPKYDLVVTPFRDGLALVKSNGQYIYIDKTGKVIWAPRRGDKITTNIRKVPLIGFTHGVCKKQRR